MAATSRGRRSNRRRAAILRTRRLAFERCEPRQLLATDLAWAIPHYNVNDVEVDSEGNVFVATDNGIGKYSPEGTLIWGKSTPYAYSLSISANGDICVGGYFQSTYTFGPGLHENQIISAGATDIFVAKFDSTGQFLWARSMGGAGDESAYGVDFDPAGNIAITGDFGGTVDFDPGVGSYPLTSGGYQDTFVAKLDSAGNFLWAGGLSGPSGPDYGDYLTCDSQGNVIVVGRFYGVVDFDPSAAVVNRFASATADGFVLKLNASGGFVWVNQLSAKLGLNGVFGVLTDEYDNIYATGEFRGSADFDSGPDTYNLFATTSSADFFIWKMNPAGNLSWAKNYSSSTTGPGDNDYGLDIARDSTGNLYVTGYFANTRGFVGQFDSSGNPMRIRELTGALNYGNGIGVDNAGNIYVGGHSEGTVDYDPSSGVNQFASAGFLLRLNAFEANATLTGRAWQDLDGNGLQDSGEPSLTDVPATLVRSHNATFGDSDDMVVVTTTTAADGNYRFEHLDWVYNYFVVSNAPAGFSSSGEAGILSISPVDQGNDDNSDNDLDPATGHTGVIALNPAQTAHVDFGFQGALANFGWAARTSTTSEEAGKFVARDSVGNVYVLGIKTTGVADDLDPGPGTMKTLSSRGFILIKYSKSGAFQWVREVTSGINDAPVGLVIDSAGYVYVAGKFASTTLSYIGYGTTQQQIDTSGGSGLETAAVFKIDTKGSLIWSRLIRTSSGGTNAARGLAIDENNNLYLMGEFTGSLSLSTDIPGAPPLIANTGAKDVYLTKMTTAGDFLWWKMLDSNSQVSANAIATDLSGNIYTTGTFSGSLDFDTSVAVHRLSGSNSTFMAKLTTDGDYVWAEQIAGGYPAGLAVTGTSLLLTGSFSGTVDFDPSPGGQTNLSNSISTAFVAKFDLEGGLSWARSLALSSNISGFIASAGGSGIAADAWGNVYVAGSFTGVADFDPGTGTFNLVVTSPDSDAFLWKLSSAGIFEDADAVGNMYAESASALLVDSIGNVVFTGTVKEAVDFDPTPATFSPPNIFSYADLFVASWLNPTPPPPGDFNGDGKVDGADFSDWQDNFPKSNGANIVDGDADGDGDVDGADFIAWQINLPVANSSISAEQGNAVNGRAEEGSATESGAENNSAEKIATAKSNSPNSVDPSPRPNAVTAKTVCPTPAVAQVPVDEDCADTKADNWNSGDQHAVDAKDPEVALNETKSRDALPHTNATPIDCTTVSTNLSVSPISLSARKVSNLVLKNKHASFIPALPTAATAPTFQPTRATQTRSTPSTARIDHQSLTPTHVDQWFAQVPMFRSRSIGRATANASAEDWLNA